ncbi:MAG: hypothetical protein ABEJ02_00680 [Candidatus Paceibacteria bacterium]
MPKFLYIATIIVFSFSILLPNTAGAVDIGGNGLLKNAAEEAGYKPDQTTEQTFAEQIGQIIKAAMSFIGIIFTVLMVYGGFLWMTARGNEDQVDKAQRIITAAVIGLIIAVGAFSISDYAVSTFMDLLS